MRQPLVLLAGAGVLLGAAGFGSALRRPEARAQEPAPRADTASPAPSSLPIQEALLKPFDLPFREPTPLEAVAAGLSKSLGGPVVLDRAALDRLELTSETTVQLELHGVRLKTGLQLLLDQVGMTYRLVPEDNLLVLTDTTGSDDPDRRLLQEVEELHRDVHALQDSVDSLFRMFSDPVEEMGPELKSPTIIEEAPADPSAPAVPGRSRPG